MLDIVFNNSAAGSLRAAQSFGQGPYRENGVTFVFSEESEAEPPSPEYLQRLKNEHNARQRKEWESATPLGPLDIFPLSFTLSLGDISQNRPSEQQIALFAPLYAHSEQEATYAKESLARALQELDRLQKAVETSDTALRIWYSDDPDDHCGLYWLLAQLENWSAFDKEVVLVKFPSFFDRTDATLIEPRGWGELSPGEWCHCLPLQHPASPVFRLRCARRWKELQAENAPLRAVINGHLESLDADFYDPFILRELALFPAEFSEAQLIGNILVKYNLGLGDAWLALRIEEWIRQGRLEPITQASKEDPIYHRILRKC